MGNPVVHFDIGCRDHTKAAAFYEELFGWTSSDFGPISKKMDTGSSSGIQGHVTALGHEPHRYVTIYIQVEDIDECLNKAQELGGDVVIPKTGIPSGGHFAWFNDADQNTLGLFQEECE